MHYREYCGTTNTARLAKLVLPDCSILIRGRPEQLLDGEKILDPKFQPLLLYPTEDSLELNAELLARFDRPINLLVPDGSWRQASKVPKRELFLKDVPRVKVSSSVLSTYRLRREPKPEGLATFEAISRALGVIEGAAVKESLDRLFDQMVTRTLRTRGTRVEDFNKPESD